MAQIGQRNDFMDLPVGFSLAREFHLALPTSAQPESAKIVFIQLKIFAPAPMQSLLSESPIGKSSIKCIPLLSCCYE